MALDYELVCCPFVPEILDLSPVCLGSYNLTCVASIDVRPIGGETRDIMPHFLGRDPAQKMNLRGPKSFLNPGNQNSGPGK